MTISESKSEGPTIGLGGFPILYKTRDRSWERTPGYPNVATLPINSYSDSKVVVQQSPAKANYSDFNSLGQPAGSGTEFTAGYALGNLQLKHVEIQGALNAKHRSDAAMTNDLLVKALAKVADAKTNLAVMFAERAKTADLVYGKANQLYRAYRAFRRGDLRQVARTLNISRSTQHKQWLEYKYGWMPLLMDVKNSAEFFAQQSLGGRPPRFTVSLEDTSDVSYTSKTLDGSYSVGSWYGWVASRGIKTIRIKIECEITNPHFNQLQQLGLTNPALVAWELVPFSFVFDWFCSVGDYLTGLTALEGVTVRRSFSSRVHSLTSRYISHAHPVVSARWPNGQPQRIRHGYDFAVETQGRSYSRSPLGVNPLSLYPPVNVPTSFEKAITGLALLRALGKRL